LTKRKVPEHEQKLLNKNNSTTQGGVLKMTYTVAIRSEHAEQFQTQSGVGLMTLPQAESLVKYLRDVAGIDAVAFNTQGV